MDSSFFGGVCVAHLFSFLYCPIMSLHSEFRIVISATISAKKKEEEEIWFLFNYSCL
jgi:hypothetical protein